MLFCRDAECIMSVAKVQKVVSFTIQLLQQEASPNLTSQRHFLERICWTG
jgi:hypothetical protein